MRFDDGERTAEIGGELGNGREPQAQSIRRFRSDERLADRVSLLRHEAGPVVGHDDVDVLVVDLDLDEDLCRSGAASVVDQLGDGRGELSFVGEDPGLAHRSVDVDIVGGQRRGPCEPDHVDGGEGPTEGSVGSACAPCVGARRLRERPDLGEGFFGRDRSGGPDLGGQADHVERSRQIVGDLARRSCDLSSAVGDRACRSDGQGETGRVVVGTHVEIGGREYDIGAGGLGEHGLDRRRGVDQCDDRDVGRPGASCRNCIRTDDDATFMRQSVGIEHDAVIHHWPTLPHMALLPQCARR